MTLRVSRYGAGVCIASLGLIALVAPAVAEPSQRDASITQDAEASGLRLTTSQFFADSTIKLSYNLTTRAPEITEPTVVTTVPSPITPIEQVDSDSSSGTDASETTTSSDSEEPVPIVIAVPGVKEPALLLRVAIHRPLNGQPLTDVVDGDPGDVIDVISGPLNQFGTRDAATEEITVNIDVPLQQRLSYRAHLDDVLEYVDTGITPVSVSVIRGTAVIAHDVTLIDVGWQQANPSPLSVAMTTHIASRSQLTIPGGHSLAAGDGSRAAQEFELLVDLLERSQIPLSVALSPELAESLANETLPTGVTTRDIDRLISTNGGEVLSLPYRSVDPFAAGAAGLEERFISELDAGDVAMRAAFPSLTPVRSVWLADDAITSSAITTEGVDLLKSEGVERLIMTDDSYVGGAPHDRIDDTQPGLFAVEATSLPVIITGAIGEISPRLDVALEDQTVLFVARIMQLRREQPELARSVVFSAPDLAIPDVETVQAIERLLSSDPTVEFMRVSELPDQIAANRAIVTPSVPQVDLAQRQLTADALQVLIDDTGSMLNETHESVAQWNELINDLFDQRGNGQYVVDTIDVVTNETSAVRQWVSVPMSGTVNLTGRDTPLPLVVENTGPEPLQVLIRLNAPRLVVPDEPLAVTLPPGVSSVQVPVEARSNGSFDVEVEVLSPAGTPVVSGVTIVAKAMTLSGFGRLVGFGLILVLVSWWVSHIRRQRQRKVAATPVETQMPASEGS
ncbi:MAG: DUF6049 family protein [Ilumatobacteraceae bacterium]|nr:DUF6049 family protein [Ilumatobacteraceae bacterium]